VQQEQKNSGRDVECDLERQRSGKEAKALQDRQHKTAKDGEDLKIVLR
jgi:hypothetical protein